MYYSPVSRSPSFVLGLRNVKYRDADQVTQGRDTKRVHCPTQEDGRLDGLEIFFTRNVVLLQAT